MSLIETRTVVAVSHFEGVRRCEVLAYKVAGVEGLVIHEAVSPSELGWMVTHAPSGKCAIREPKETRDEAIAEVERLAALADWAAAEEVLLTQFDGWP